MTAEGTRIKTQMFASDNTRFCIYAQEVNLWKEECGLQKEEQGIVLWMALPKDDPSDIKELILDKIGADQLRKETSLQKLMEAMNKAFKPTNEHREQKIYNNYYGINSVKAAGVGR